MWKKADKGEKGRKEGGRGEAEKERESEGGEREGKYRMRFSQSSATLSNGTDSDGARQACSNRQVSTNLFAPMSLKSQVPLRMDRRVHAQLDNLKSGHGTILQTLAG